MSKILLIKFLPDVHMLLGLAILAFITSYIIYRLSLHIHAIFGEMFKSVFDNYRENISFENIIDEVSRITKDSTIANLSKKEQYKIVWRYLHNYRIKIDDKVYSPDEIKKSPKKKINFLFGVTSPRDD